MENSASELGPRPFGAMFETSIKELADARRWPLKELRADQAVLEVKAESGHSYELRVNKHGEWIKFAASSDYAISEEDQGEGATELLEFNGVSSVGYWALVETMEPSGGRTWCYTVIRTERIDFLDSELFEMIAEDLAEECESLEEASSPDDVSGNA